MTKLLAKTFLLACAISSTVALADTFNLGFASFHLSNPPLGEVDITNQTGANNSGDSTFPIATQIVLSTYTLQVNFVAGGSRTFTQSDNYFLLDADLIDYDGQPDFPASDPISSINLSGTFAPTSVLLFDGTPVTLDPNFSLTITDPLGVIQDGDFALWTANTATPVTGVPEPSALFLLGAGLAGIAAYRRRRWLAQASRPVVLGALSPLLLAALTANLSAATANVKLNASTSPSSGVSGTSQVWITGSGFPGVPNAGATTVSLSSTCAGPAAVTALASSEKAIIGSYYELEFLVPASLGTGTYYVSISGTTTTSAAFVSSNCSQIRVTHVNPTLASCNPGSSMGILSYNATGVGSTPITAYVPNGAWAYGSTGIQVVPLEGGGTPTAVTTTTFINSCSSNSSTGQTVCIDNNTGVYVLQGNSITTTLNSAANSPGSFTGGSCFNCTVAINNAAGTKGQAVIGIGYSTSPTGVALQFLDLGTNTFGTPVAVPTYLSEDILWDPFRNRILSPTESNQFDIVGVSGSGLPGPGTTSGYTKSIPVFGEEADTDSAGLDCTTNIAVSPLEFTGELFFADLSQATFTAGSPGNWSGPSQVVEYPEFEGLSAGASAIAIAPGSTHLGIVNGEFGGNLIGAIQLPSASVTGVAPSLVDYTVVNLPVTPNGDYFSNGYDPHTTTAYTSPNNGKAYAVVVSWAPCTNPSVPTYVGVIDLAALLAAPRVSGQPHTVDPTYDLIAHGVLTYYAATSPAPIAGCGTGVSAGVGATTGSAKAGAKPGNKPIH